MKVRGTTRVLGALFAASWAVVGQAHESRPFHVEIVELHPEQYRVSWKIPASIWAQNLPRPDLPEDCAVAKPSEAPQAAYFGRALYRCEVALHGRTVAITYPVYNPSISTMITLRTLKGEEHLGLLGPDEQTWLVPESETKSHVAAQYIKLGIEHIWAGIDHLLFLVCLLWIAGDLRRVLITVTGFTVAHSLTLALSALDILRIPPAPVEAVIALSIVFLAREIAIGRRDSLTWSHPIAVSSSFGLLHGLGFAAVLNEIGLPQTELLWGLLFFNLGVEVGQLVFIAAVWGLGVAVAMIPRHWRGAGLNSALIASRMGFFATYAVGVVSCYWVVTRVGGY